MDKIIYILGFGCGDEGDITLKTLNLLKECEVVYTRTMKHTSSSILIEHNIDYIAFDDYYDTLDTFDEVYDKIAETVINSDKQKVGYIVPGSAVFAELAVQKILAKATCEIKIIPSVSFIDGIFASLKYDASSSFKLIDALSLGQQKPDVYTLNIITQVYDRSIASDVKLELMKYYKDETEVLLVTGASSSEERIVKIPLYDIDRHEEINHLTSIVIYPQEYLDVPNNFNSLVQLIKTLRGEGGCPWDAEQTNETLTKYLIEEAYEVVNAVNMGDYDNLCEELGDLLLHIVMHSEIADELYEFNIYDVIKNINEKMVRRHPHVFKNQNLDEDMYKQWESIKNTEHNFKCISEKLKDIPQILPSLIYAKKVQSKSDILSLAGENLTMCANIIENVCSNLIKAVRDESNGLIEIYFSELLFVLLRLSIVLDIDAEEDLKAYSKAYIERFELVENNILNDGLSIQEISADIFKKYWKNA